ncbi:MAG: nuclear protein [Cirrosporium novae-zelandiae]|nr:MAG: nuclear protein [Cirrosporium novae-zelandiae]
MARLATALSPNSQNSDLLSGDPLSERQRSLLNTPTSIPMISQEPDSSDKENRYSRQAKGKGREKRMAPLQTQDTPITPDSDGEAHHNPNKRRKVGRNGDLMQSQIAHERALIEAADKNLYDPDQKMEERRAVRKGLRDLLQDVTDSKAEYLASGPEKFLDTLHKSNDLFAGVKQTSDATIDSRVLNELGDRGVKILTITALGDKSRMVDIDEFVSKCITFMQLGGNVGHNEPSSSADVGTQSTQRRQKRARCRTTGVDFEDDDDEALDWDILGREACFPSNKRPPVPGFLLGPLSVQKKIRRATQRVVRSQRQTQPEVRPEEVKPQDIQQSENSSLTKMCTGIRILLGKVERERMEKAEGEFEEAEDGKGEELSSEEQQQILDRNHVTETGAIPFFPFVINPKSFGQTVENLFYVSFLIRDGLAAVGEDRHGLPTLQASKPESVGKLKEKGIKKHQAVFCLDWPTWEGLIDAFSIRESTIPHRQEDEAPTNGARGWHN